MRFNKTFGFLNNSKSFFNYRFASNPQSQIIALNNFIQCRTFLSLQKRMLVMTSTNSSINVNPQTTQVESIGKMSLLDIMKMLFVLGINNSLTSTTNLLSLSQQLINNKSHCVMIEKINVVLPAEIKK